MPIVAKPQRKLDFWIDLDLILDERTEFVDPIERSARALLRSKDIGTVVGVVRKRPKFEGAEAVGVIIHGASAELRELNTGTYVMLAVAPRNDLVDVNGVLGAREVGLCAPADERAAHLDGLRVGYTLRDIFILLEGD